MQPKCPICDNWNKTPHAKRFTTPIPPQYAEEAMVIGYWIGTRQPNVKDLCKKHVDTLLALDKQNQKRTAPTIPPPPPRMPISQVIANKMGQDFNVQPVPTESTGSETMTSQETLRNNFMAIARSCATEFLKQRGTPPNQPEATTDNSAPANVEDKDKNETIINNLQQALFTTQRALLDIAQHSTDPEVAQFAARVLDGNTLPSPPPEPLPPGMIPCAVCHKGVIPGQMHTC